MDEIYCRRQKKKGKTAFDLICLPLTEMGKTTGEASSEVRSSFGHIVYEIFTGHLSRNVE